VKFQPYQRVQFKSVLSEKVFKGFVIRGLKDGYYLIDDGTGRVPRVIHEDRLKVPEINVTGVFA
jgi:hypothetical protein